MPMMISEFWIRGNILEYIVVDEKVSTGEKKNVKIYVNCYSREKNVCVCGDQTDGSNDHPSNEMRWDKNVLWFFGAVLLLPTIEIRTQKLQSTKLMGSEVKRRGGGDIN